MNHFRTGSGTGRATGPAVAVPRGRRTDLRPAHLLRYSARWQVTTGLGVRLGAISGTLTLAARSDRGSTPQE
jgi:hypothetical protein